MPGRRARPRNRPPRRRPSAASGWRAAAALALLVAVVGLVVVLALRSPRRQERVAEAGARELVLELARRAGCGPERVEFDQWEGGAGGVTATVRAPAGFDLQQFVLAVEAAAHNRGERVEALPLAEGGGYGLARLEGSLAGEPVRIVVVGERPRRRAATGSGAPSPRLAVILDDAGNSLDVVHAVAALPPEVAVAVLPNAPHSAAVARALGGGPREVLLHMPMEPGPGASPGPGPGALTVGLGREEVQARLEAALEVVPAARGVNNHMGSRATADRQLMGWLMEALRRRGLYFIDSRTTPDSVALAAARQARVPAAERDVFLDVVVEPEAIRRALRRVVSDARAAGTAVAIGHVHPITIETLAVELPRIVAEGVRLVPPSRLVATPR